MKNKQSEVSQDG